MSKNTDDLLMKLAVTGVNHLEKECENFTSEQWQSIETRAASLACRMMYLSEYAMHRGAAGCGDSGHDAATKAANIKFKRARKLAGFTYP